MTTKKWYVARPAETTQEREEREWKMWRERFEREKARSETPPEPIDFRETLNRAATGKPPLDSIVREMANIGDFGVSTKSGLVIPDELLRRREAVRALNMGTSGEGGYLKAADFQKEFFGTIYNPVAARVGIVTQSARGVTYRAGIQTPMVAEEVPEGEELTEPEAVFNVANVNLRNIGASGVVTRNLLVATGGWAEDVVRAEMDQAFDRKIDELIFDEILDAAPVVVHTPSGAFAWADALAMKKSALDGDADPEGCFFIGATDTMQLLEGRERVTGSGRYLVEDGKLANVPVIATPSMPSGSLVFGDFRNGVVLFDLGITDLVVHPITPNGNVRFVAWRYLDVAVGRGRRLIKVAAVS